MGLTWRQCEWTRLALNSGQEHPRLRCNCFLAAADSADPYSISVQDMTAPPGNANTYRHPDVNIDVSRLLDDDGDVQTEIECAGVNTGWDRPGSRNA